MKTHTLLALLLVALIGITSTLNADVRLPRIFGDNMVLQQQTRNAIWGWADQGERVKVSASWGASAVVKADSQGRWKLFLDTPSFGTGHSLTISGNNTFYIRNVAIGEVWLCAGQSNMGWSTGNSFHAEMEENIQLPNFRIFKSQREHWHEPLGESRDRLQQWKPCDPKSAAETSAVSYYFGKTLHQRLDRPVGIIVQAYAGTPIEGWMPWEIQQDDARSIEHKQSLDKNAMRIISRGETVEKVLSTFEQELAVYNEKIDAGETMKNAFRALQPPFITRPASLGHQYPAHIFNAMIHPIQPYGIRGMIWYQGERNSKNVPQALHYRQQLTQLIRFYRTSWNELSEGNVAENFPFQFTQLPSWGPPQTKPVEGLEAPWAVTRESMRLVEQDVDAASMVVSIDTGDPIQLHPKNKKPLGIRHALLALKETYGKEIVGRGPRYRHHVIDKGKMIIEFDSLGSGLMAANPGALDSFAIAGKDRKWHWAQAVIEGDTVVLSTNDVPMPEAARYGWAMNASGRNLLYNLEGFPATPFRTDNWPLFDPDADLVEVLKPTKPDGYVSVDWERPPMKEMLTLESGGYFIPQSWSQEKNYKRMYYVHVPQNRDHEKLPVFIFLHGNGGNGKGAMNGFLKRHPKLVEKYHMVFPNGYLKSWNIVSERSKADDLKFIEAIIKNLTAYSNVQKNNITIMGSSNGSALVNQLAIESRLPSVRNYISSVSPLNVYQHDGDNFKAKGRDNNYLEVMVPMKGKRFLNISGIEDKLVPYHGGPSRVIPAKGGKLGFVAAEESIFLWAKAMGYQGEKLSSPRRTIDPFEIFSYLNGDVVHYKVKGEGHSATRAVDEDVLLEFLETDL